MLYPCMRCRLRQWTALAVVVQDETMDNAPLSKAFPEIKFLRPMKRIFGYRLFDACVSCVYVYVSRCDCSTKINNNGSQHRFAALPVRIICPFFVRKHFFFFVFRLYARLHFLLFLFRFLLLSLFWMRAPEEHMFMCLYVCVRDGMIEWAGANVFFAVSTYPVLLFIVPIQPI